LTFGERSGIISMTIKVGKGVNTIKIMLKEVREKKGMSQVELAQKSGVSRNTIMKIESNSCVSLKTKTIVKLANALGVTAEEIFCFK